MEENGGKEKGKGRKEKRRKRRRKVVAIRDEESGESARGKWRQRG